MKKHVKNWPLMWWVLVIWNVFILGSLCIVYEFNAVLGALICQFLTIKIIEIENEERR